MEPTDLRQLLTTYVTTTTDRRQRASATYMGLTSAFVALVPFALNNTGGSVARWLALAAIGATGLTSALLWLVTIRRYSRLLAYWYSKLRADELQYPNGQRVFTEEYETLYQGGDKSFSDIESALPLAYALAYGGLIIVCVGAAAQA